MARQGSPSINQYIFVTSAKEVAGKQECIVLPNIILFKCCCSQAGDLLSVSTPHPHLWFYCYRLEILFKRLARRYYSCIIESKYINVKSVVIKIIHLQLELSFVPGLSSLSLVEILLKKLECFQQQCLYALGYGEGYWKKQKEKKKDEHMRFTHFIVGGTKFPHMD